MQAKQRRVHAREITRLCHVGVAGCIAIAISPEGQITPTVARCMRRPSHFYGRGAFEPVEERPVGERQWA